MKPSANRHHSLQQGLVIMSATVLGAAVATIVDTVNLNGVMVALLGLAVLNLLSAAYGLRAFQRTLRAGQRIERAHVLLSLEEARLRGMPPSEWVQEYAERAQAERS